MKNTKYLAVIFILGAVSIVSWLAYFPGRTDIAAKIKVSDFPKAVGEWNATDMPISEKDYQILETRNLFVRDYKNSAGDSVYLYLVYSEDNRKVSHPPEVCYLGSGVTIADKFSVKILGFIPATAFIVEKSNIRQLVVYWFKAGNLYTENYLKQQIKIVIGRILGKRTSGALIRLSADIRGDSKENALELINNFAADIKPLLDRYIP